MTNNTAIENAILQNQLMIMRALDILLSKVILEEHSKSALGVTNSPVYQMTQALQKRCVETHELFEWEVKSER